jgi:HMG (high mobility group) box
MPAKKESDQSPVKKGARKVKSADDKPKVKRAPSAYIVFCTEKRTEAKESNPDATFGELGKILGLMWGQLDDKGKEVRDPWRIPIVVY